MGLFSRKKKKSDIVDLRTLEAIKRTRKSATGSTTAYVSPYLSDSSSTSSSSSTGTASSDSGAFGFLGDLAGAAESGATETPRSLGYSESNYGRYNSSSSYSNPDINDKLEMINQQLYKITQRLELLELKLNKIERKPGYY